MISQNLRDSVGFGGSLRVWGLGNEKKLEAVIVFWCKDTEFREMLSSRMENHMETGIRRGPICCKISRIRSPVLAVSQIRLNYT